MSDILLLSIGLTIICNIVSTYITRIFDKIANILKSKINRQKSDG